MAIELALAAYLLTRPPVTSLIGKRIYAERAEQFKDPCTHLVYELVGGENFMHAGGASSLSQADIRITCHGANYLKARELFDVIEDELNGFRGLWGTTRIDRCELAQPATSTANPTQGTAVGYPALRSVLSVHYFKAIPNLGQP